MSLDHDQSDEDAAARQNPSRGLLQGMNLQKITEAFVARFAHKGPSSLANRFLLLQFSWTFVIYVLVIAALWFITNLVIENSVRHQGEGWIAKLDDLGIPIYASNDPDQLKEAISYLRNFPEIASAQYFDDSGKKILAEYTRKSGSISNFPPLSDDAIQTLGRVDVAQKTLIFEKGSNYQMRISAPIWIKSIANDGMIDYSLDDDTGEKVETIGFIGIVLDYGHISRDLNRNIFYASILIAVMMLVAAFVARVMVRWALFPLSELEEPLTRLANGDTDVTVSTTGDKEIARIGIALNTTISALKERDEVLRRMANHDALTGLVNRSYFVDQLEHEIRRAARSGGSGALFFFDLDRFKNINDTYGHAAGDRLLIQVARQLRQRIRESDLAARFGGDEFTLLAYNVSRERAREIAESFIELMRDYTFHEAGDIIKIYFSIGVTLIDDGAITAQEYLKEADTAVHQAKALGRNGYQIFSRGTLNIATESDTGWHERLQEALHKRQAILYYQPLAGLKGQHEYIHEVLLRLPDLMEQVTSPSAFMPAAERFGMMAEFDCQVIRMAARALAELNNPDLVFSVNLSEQFFTMDDIPELLEEIIGMNHIAPAQFIFELSERYLVHNIDRYQSILAELAQLGYQLAIDDYGAGFVSFNYIKQIPAHYLKIDSALIEKIAVDNIARVTVRAIVEAAAELNMRTIAKNVVDDAGISLLRELGIDFAQGNHIAVPAPELILDVWNKYSNIPRATLINKYYS